MAPHSPLETRNSKLRTLSIGGATFDLFLDVNADMSQDCNGVKSFAFPLGAKISVKNVIGACGGGADNTAVGLSRLGCKAAFSGVLGDDQWGREIKENMEREKVDTSFLAVIEHEPSSFSLILQAENGERTILTHKSMDRHFHDVTFDREAAGSVDAVYLNHIHEDTCVIENDIVNVLIASPATHLTWNPGGCQIEAGLEAKANRDLLAATDVLLLNKEEALAFAKTDSVREALKLLTSAGVKYVCITDGPKGCDASDGTQLYHCPTLPCEVVDSTGAGDAFGTAVTWALLTGKNLPTALKTGTINALSVVRSIGAQHGLLTDTQIESRLANTVLDVSIEQL
jgi:ribokinase